MSNDVRRFDISFLYIPFLWIGPLQTIVITYFLWQEVGVSSVLGVITLLIFIPLQSKVNAVKTNSIIFETVIIAFGIVVWLGSKISEVRAQTAERTDKRVQLMNEIISSLQVIKMCTWEPFFTSLTQYARK